MKIFCTSDIHGRYNDLRKIVNFVNEREDIDVAVFCGDISSDHDYSTVKELSEIQEEDYLCFKTMINEIKNKRVYYILGNHDVFLPDKKDMNYLPNLASANIKNTIIPFEIVNIQCYGISREGTEIDIKEALDEMYDINEQTIIVAHQPPYNCLDSSISGHHYGSSSVKDMILNRKPNVFICGHVHKDYGSKNLGTTLVVNCACDDFIVRGMVIDTDTNSCEEVILE